MKTRYFCFYKFICTGVVTALITSCGGQKTLVNRDFSGLFPDKVPTNICYLRTTRSVYLLLGSEQTFNATGTLFSGEYLITAGHNVYDSWRSKLVGVDVVCKSSDGSVVTSTITPKDIARTREVTRYDDSGHAYAYDYAFIKLPAKIDVQESVILGSGKESLKVKNIKVAGYPGGELQYGQGSIKKNRTKTNFSYKVDTAKGMSGGPVWAKYNGVEYLVGVHVSEGTARTVDEDLVEEFHAWRKQFN
ncbi:serine protease [Pleionea sp. CnH1-48]|uniref:trypsin-like serine peptidase n=1 Tax=Pleionea sp. CnH1-48 TaxID=2954494 RepID=UPI0020970586|nr:trypsin-like peptidase domain-containing protein [Pleionea sp. CnH1-48]MCO7222706.1 trypsin-like serine protease [Pleionea sp. CnH1-48]